MTYCFRHISDSQSFMSVYFLKNTSLTHVFVHICKHRNTLTFPITKAMHLLISFLTRCNLNSQSRCWPKKFQDTVVYLRWCHHPLSDALLGTKCVNSLIILLLKDDYVLG